MSITRKDVQHVAKLAHLELSEAEVDRLTTDLARIVAYVEELSEVDTANVAPTNSVSVEVAPLRDDEERAGLSHDDALRDAPRTSGGGFAVPTFVEEA
jgi:aspartyl-tRNA(Asn)/glutamyl-tRNA(Gln) amidotransferase subunit C